VELPDGYVDCLCDELAPFGLEFGSTVTTDEVTSVGFQADPESFVHDHPGLGIVESYGEKWPPQFLTLWVRFDADNNPIEISFEVFDLLIWAASVDAGLRDRLNTLVDPSDHAAAVGQALAAVLYPPDPEDAFLE
jgi:hypothetical protein